MCQKATKVCLDRRFLFDTAHKNAITYRFTYPEAISKLGSSNTHTHILFLFLYVHCTLISIQTNGVFNVCEEFVQVEANKKCSINCIVLQWHDFRLFSITLSSWVWISFVFVATISIILLFLHWMTLVSKEWMTKHHYSTNKVKKT